MFRAENALYRFDENGEIIVSNGDINSMNRAITDRKETDNVLVFNQAFAMLRTPCGLLNGSGWQYAQYNSDRRGFVSADLFYNFYTRRTGYITVETVYKTECRAEKRSIFGWWYDYQTDNVLKITEVKIKIPSPWPASWGIKPIEKFYLNRMICTSNAKSVSFTDLVNSETVPSDRINRNVKPNFEYVDVSYTNRGGVSIDYRCDN